MQSIRELVHANRTIKVYLDPDPLNPRKEWDNATIMVHWHRRYDLGDKRVEPCTAEELKEEYAERGDPVLAIQPLYLYDHSGLSVSTGAFSCSFDSGQVGWVFVTKSKSVEMGFEGYTPDKLEEVIKGEVKSYDDYLTGQVYGYEVLGKDGDHIDSCWGYVGDIDDCVADAKRAAEGSVDPGVERDAEELASRATYAGVSL